MAQAAEVMRGRVCIVTGGSSGIGKETALGLARQGATVIVVARDRSRGEAAVEEIKARSGNDGIELLLADLSSQASVRQLAGTLLGREQPLHVLVNNAGGVFSQRTLSPDGIELTWALNHLAYFLLTNLLLDRLKASGTPERRARIVNVSSVAQRAGHIDFDDLERGRRYRAFDAYSQSKLANIIFTYELVRRLAGTNVTANCVHPGLVASGFGLNNSGWLSAGLRLVRPFARTVEQGADTSIYVASSPALEGVSGKYFVDRKPARSVRESYDEVVAHRLWQVSAGMTGLAG